MTDIKQTLELALDALKETTEIARQQFSGYGFYRSKNPHNFYPDVEQCSQAEIDSHSKACECYDQKMPIPNGSWGIGTYIESLPWAEQAITALEKLLAEIESAEPVAWMSPGKEALEFARQDTVYGSHTIPLYLHPQPTGEVVISTDEQGACVAVTRQDEEGRILSVIWQAPKYKEK
jgi:hypothetical protein